MAIERQHPKQAARLANLESTIFNFQFGYAGFPSVFPSKE